MIGAVAHRNDRLGLVARLVVHVAAILEPFYPGMLSLSTAREN